MVPTVALPPGTPLTDQVTPVVVVPVTVAVNGWESPARTDVEPGETLTVMLGGGGPPEFEPPPHPATQSRTAPRTRKKGRRITATLREASCLNPNGFQKLRAHECSFAGAPPRLDAKHEAL